jgi:hypothetical protein
VREREDKQGIASSGLGTCEHALRAETNHDFNALGSRCVKDDCVCIPGLAERTVWGSERRTGNKEQPFGRLGED